MPAIVNHSLLDAGPVHIPQLEPVVVWAISRFFQALVQSTLSPPHHQRWQPSRDDMTRFSVLAEVDRSHPQPCRALVLTASSFSDPTRLCFIVISRSPRRTLPRPLVLLFTYGYTHVPTYASHLLSPLCHLWHQLREGASWSIFNIETQVQSQAFSGSNPDPDDLESLLIFNEEWDSLPWKFIKMTVWGWGDGQSVKCLLCNCENLSSC